MEKTYVKALITSTNGELPKYVKDGIRKFVGVTNRYMFMSEKIEAEINSFNIKLKILDTSDFDFINTIRLLIIHEHLEVDKVIKVLDFLEWRANISVMGYENGTSKNLTNTTFGAADSLKELEIDNHTILEIEFINKEDFTIDIFEKILKVFNDIAYDEWHNNKPEDRVKLSIYIHKNKVEIIADKNRYKFPETIASVYCNNYRLDHRLNDFYTWLKDNSNLKLSNYKGMYGEYTDGIDWKEFDSILITEINYLQTLKKN